MFESFFDFLILFDSLKVFLAFISEVAFERRECLMEIEIIGVDFIEFPFKEMPVGDILFTSLIKDAPLRTFVIKLINGVSVVADERINMILAVDGDAHDFFGGVDLFEGHGGEFVELRFVFKLFIRFLW